MNDTILTSRDNFCLDILKGLAVYYDSPFVSDIRETASRFPRPELGYALNHNQTTSKKWLIDCLHDSFGGRLGCVYVLGGWFGVLGAMLLHDQRFDIDRVISVDMDLSCEAVARSLNRSHKERFIPVTMDMNALNYVDDTFPLVGAASPDLIINTSCEHLQHFDQWYAIIPDGKLLLLQSNNYYGVDGHVGCVDDLAGFKDLAPMTDVLFEGALELNKYTRFMVIGRK